MAESYISDILPTGTKLDHDRYLVNSMLARGGFGITYLAIEHLGRKVAIKEFFPDGYASRNQRGEVYGVVGDQGDIFAEGLNKFLREAKTIAQFKHPNLVHILNYFEENNTAYIVMNFERGISFDSYVRRHEINETELIAIFRAISDGLSLLHEKGIIHRDIKADNICMRDDGTPVLLDLGSSRDIIHSSPYDLTRMYTPTYAPYEQIDPTWGKQGAWTDIYALGVMLYFAVSGSLPINSQIRASAFINKNPDPYQSLLAGEFTRYSHEFLKAIDYALRFDPKERPASLNEWILELAANDGKADIHPDEKTDISANDLTLITTIHTKVQSKGGGQKKSWRKSGMRLFFFILAIIIAAASAWFIQEISLFDQLTIYLKPEPKPEVIRPEAPIQAAIYLTTSRGDFPVFKRGEEIRIEVAVTENLYVYCFYQDEIGNLYRLFPNSYYSNPYLVEGTSIIIPSSPRRMLAEVQGNDSCQCLGTSIDVTQMLLRKLDDNGAMQPISTVTIPEIRSFIGNQFPGNPMETAEIPIQIE